MNSFTPFGGNPNQMQNFMSFVQSMKGVDPKEKVNSLLASGQMTQDQFKQLEEMANMFFGKK